MRNFWKGMERNVEEVPSDEARKKITQKSKWKREKERVKRYSAPDLPARPTCNHNGTLACSKLSLTDMAALHNQFYKFKDKIYQDNFILKHCTSEAPQRRRTRTGTGSAKQMSIKYEVRKISGEKVRVCKTTFLKTLQIKKTRVLVVLNRHKQTGLMANETRGGDRKSEIYNNLKDTICEFIKKFKGMESHYCRSKSRRIYLPSELNIAKMYKIFLKEYSNMPCKESYFRHIFNTKFNIGFSNPRSDKCSKCLQYEELIKLEKNEEKLTKLKTELKVHKTRGATFFEFLKDSSPDIMILSFDCQKNQNLPKIPDQATYYSRQLYMYNFTIVKGTSHDNLSPTNVFSYVWTEDQHAKGSNEIASSVYHCLTSQATFEGIKTLRLVCDGCPGQNKNSILVAMVSKWLASNAPSTLKKVEMIFPVPGHSYIPPDRVFGVIEKEIKTRNTILSPEEYIQIFAEHGNIQVLGRDATVFDWKTSMREVMKDVKDLHFKISQCKRIIFSRLKRDNRNIVVRGEVYYNNDTCVRRCITRVGKFPGDINPSIIPPGNIVKSAKIEDVKKLLKTHFGNEWMERPDLQYYTSIICPMETEEDTEEHNLLCDQYVDYEPPTTLVKS